MSSPATDPRCQPLQPAEELARLWEQGNRVEVDAFLKSVGPLTAGQLAEVFHVDQHHRWEAGERPLVESYLQRIPEVSADPDAVVDIIFHEYLIRERLGDCPDATQFAASFPAYADSLRSQIAFHLLLKNVETRFGEADAAAATISQLQRGEIPADHRAQARIGLLALGGMSSRREVQLLLRQRLRLVSMIGFAVFVLPIPFVWSVLTGYWGVAIYAGIIVETGLLAVLLSSRRSFSMTALRWIEACLTGSLLLYFAWEQVHIFRSGAVLALSGQGWMGPLVAARSLSWSWAVAIILYGIWIPNTVQRSLIVLSIMFGLFLAITVALALTATSATSSEVTGYVLYSTTHMAAALAVAIFGAYRIRTLQRAVSEARRLGPYRLIRHLGSGGMGDVYLAEHGLLRRPCALKLIRPEQSGDAHFLSRFEREVQTMATLTHPNTVRIYDYGLAADGTFYYAMEYLPGLSLQELVTRHGPLPPERVTYLLRQVCGALREAHDVGLVHRDVKPANILACQNGGMHDVAKLLDFGLVRRHGLGSGEHNLTGAGGIAGTPAFMSPEQAADATEVDQRSDIYSLGAVAYFLLTGRPPFVHATSVQTMAAHLSDLVVPPSHIQQKIPTDLEEVVLRCLEKKPERRFSDAAAVETALARCACRDGWSWEQAADWWRNRKLAHWHVQVAVN
jgi:serine/threonine-protein kinase